MSSSGLGDPASLILGFRVHVRLVVIVLLVLAAGSRGTAQDSAPATKSAPAEKATPAEKPKALPEAAWTPIFEGVDLAHAEARSPRPLQVHGVRIALGTPGLRFLATPSNGDRPLDTDGRTTSAFLEEHHLQLAVNASPYEPVSQEEGSPRNVLGVSKSAGELYSPAERGYAALLISSANEVWVSAPPVDASRAHNAVGGFGLLLVGGKNVGAEDALHPRTLAGVSADRRRLYLVVIDGRQPGYSEGVTTEEAAEWLRAFGAEDGINLDGGGSTALVIEDETKRSRVINRPIHGLVPGRERVNANHLGVFAKRLPKPKVGVVIPDSPPPPASPERPSPDAPQNPASDASSGTSRLSADP